MPQSLTRLLVHIIFSTKDRQPFITPKIEPSLHAYMATIFKTMESPAILIGGHTDHIHALIVLSKNMALAKIIERVKHDSSLWVKTIGSEHRSFYWQGGYAGFSIGESGIAQTTKYIANQKEHHKRHSFKPELRAFFKKYNIQYDERYVWD